MTYYHKHDWRQLVNKEGFVNNGDHNVKREVFFCTKCLAITYLDYPLSTTISVETVRRLVR